MFSKASSIFLIFAITKLLFGSTTCVEFVYNSNFTTTNTFLVGATVTSSSPSIITLTKSFDSSGRALYPSPISVTSSGSPLPFTTSFIFSMVPIKYTDSFSFVFLSSSDLPPGFSTDFLGVDFEIWRFNDAIEIVSNSTVVSSALPDFYGGRYRKKFTEPRLNNGDNYQAWIEFSGSEINVTIAKAGSSKPIRPLISKPLNLSGLLLDNMFVGFTSDGSKLADGPKILSWSFSNSNFSIGDALITKNLPSFKTVDDSLLKSKGFIIGVSVMLLLVCVIGLIGCYVIIRQRRRVVEEDVEDWEREYWPHRVEYIKVLEATRGFSEENVMGYGGNSKVYKGLLEGKEVAVKKIMIMPRESTVGGTSEFLAEVSSLGRLRHKNIVGLKGWCKKKEDSLILIYEYMENGSVDKRIFDCNDDMLNWEERMRVIRDVASGMLYLHEGWESKVLHRDIKSSNVLLDKDMNARIGDFGLAKCQTTKKETVSTTHIVGTVGYMAPELVKTGRASAQTDVYSFGVFVLEVVCGRRSIEEGREGIVEWVWGLLEREKVVDSLDERIKVKGRFETKKVEMALRVGLLCVHHDPRMRPEMRQVIQILEQGRLSDEGGEREREDMEVSLLERMKSSYLLGRQQQHPTFQDTWNSSSYSISLESYDSIYLGR